VEVLARASASSSLRSLRQGDHRPRVDLGWSKANATQGGPREALSLHGIELGQRQTPVRGGAATSCSCEPYRRLRGTEGGELYR
jgi:hypothetical protein